MTLPYKVLFLSTGNSVRSIMAEALLNARGRGLFKGHSAGSRPTGAIHPLALRMLELNGLTTSRLRSKSWDEFTGPKAAAMDFIFTVSDPADSADCLAWPGAPITANWTIPDPAAAARCEADRMAAFEATYRQINRLVRLFCSISHGTLDRMALTWSVHDIERSAELPANLGSSVQAARALAEAPATVPRRRGRPPKERSMR